MKRHVGGLISFSLLTLITGGFQPDAPIGGPVLAARVGPKTPNVLRGAIAFFIREFCGSGGVGSLPPDRSHRTPAPSTSRSMKAPRGRPTGHDWRSRETPCCTSSTSMERA